MKNKFIYNHKDTLKSFLGVVENHIADCFEGSISFAYVLLYLWGYDPRVVFIQAFNDTDHTIIVYRLKDKFGSVAMSRHQELMGKPAIYSNLKDLMISYHPDYTSDYPEYLGQLSMVGYSDPVDLVEKFGTRWFFLPGDNALNYLYEHIADNVLCTNIFTQERYPYPPED